ncbi:Glyco_tranf_GTA_type domain containing protein [Flavobacteriaceae bacterium]
MTSLLKREDFEILVATKNKSSLAFLEAMFPFEHFSNFNILIINQSDDKVLTSNFDTIRVINTNEKGLSKSRNLAINNATKKICLITDDDVVYSPNFDKEIITAFNQKTNASIITFNHQREGLNKPQNNSLTEYNHSMKSIWNVCSIEISFRLKDIKDNNICFDENFGLGSYFETAEEYLFLRDAIKLRLKVLFYPFIIVTHPLLCSGQYQGDDKILFARAALFYKIKANLVYVWLLKYVFFLVRENYIDWNVVVEKYKVGLSGIQKYKELEKL